MSLGEGVKDLVDVVFTQGLRRDRASVRKDLFSGVRRNNPVVEKHGKLPTWKTLGALTREARADDRVAENVPAMMRGPHPDTMVIT